MLISSLAILQRREGGRIALINELDHGGKLLVIYNLHLESRGSEHGRLLQLDEVLADAQQYPTTTPVIVAGDLNTKSWHSPLIARLRDAGYHSCLGGRRIRTHIIIGALDWVFVRGPVDCEGTQVHRDFHSSGHFLFRSNCGSEVQTPGPFSALRIGLIVPSSNTVMEPDFHRYLSAGIVSTARIFLEEVTREAEIRMLEEDLPKAVDSIRTTAPNVVVFGCTSAGTLGRLAHK